MVTNTVAQLVPGTRYHICYLSKDGSDYTERFIQVEDVVQRSGVWLVIAHCELRNERRSFLLSGICDVRSCALPPQRTFGPVVDERPSFWLPILRGDTGAAFAFA